MKRLTLLVSLAGVLLACSSSPKPIAMMGSDEDIDRMVGSWMGTYEADAGDRSGTIQFELDRDADTATGQVVMYFGVFDPARPSEEQDVQSLRLAISFIQLGDGFVSGRLSPYLDPTCECMIETLFQGKLINDVIEGTFSSHGTSERLLRSGTWKVIRASRSPLRHSPAGVEAGQQDLRSSPASAIPRFTISIPMTITTSPE